MYKKGFTFTSGSGLVYEKLGDNDFDYWVATNSTYLVQTGEDPKKLESYELHPESEKPLYDKHNHLNRFGFKWTDKQVKDYYRL